MKHQLRLSALGMVNVLGQNPTEIYDKLINLDRSVITQNFKIGMDKITSLAAIRVDLNPLTEFPDYDCHNNRIAAIALESIFEPIKKAIDLYGPAKIGVVMGTSTSGVQATTDALRYFDLKGAFPENFHYRQHEINGLADFIAKKTGAQGPCYSVSTACSSSAKVFGSARSLLELGACEAVILGGCDSLCDLTIQGFSSLDALCRGDCLPFSGNRDGLMLGEGAAIFLLEKKSGGVQLMGVGESQDAHHVSAPHPEGRGATAAMKEALLDAGLLPKQIDYLNPHGTGTFLNDQMEAWAIKKLFDFPLPLSSTKSLTGHCLGAAGAIEAGILWLVLSQRFEKRLPPHFWDGQKDPELPELNLIEEPICLPDNQELYFQSNSFAFGGNNTSIVLGLRD